MAAHVVQLSRLQPDIVHARQLSCLGLHSKMRSTGTEEICLCKSAQHVTPQSAALRSTSWRFELQLAGNTLKPCASVWFTQVEA